MGGRLWNRAGLFELFALGVAAAAHGFGNQRVGQNQIGAGDIFDRKQNVSFLRAFVILDVVTNDANAAAFEPLNGPAEPLAAFMRRSHLDFHEMTDIAFEIGAADQRAVDARRGDFQSVGALDRIGDVHHRGQRL